MHFQLKTPVVLIIFNRPETTSRVFEEIRKARPPLLLLVADGPRSGHSSDVEQCAEARAIVEQVDWDCEIRKNYSEINLGCGKRVSSGLDWVFNEVEEAIILEDDCLPHATFFRYCEELLRRCRNDERISHVSGTNLLFGKKRTEYSYYFSLFGYIWGWASWRRSWKNYDVGMNLWPEIRDGGWLGDVLGNKRFVPRWTRIFEKVHRREIDAWAYQWVFHCWIHGRLAISPNVNLVRNIGFGTNATHTTGEKNKFTQLEMEPMDFPLSHPPFLVRDTVSDEDSEMECHTGMDRFLSLLDGIRRLLGN